LKYIFVQLLAFSAKARKLRLTLDDLREIENDITAHPTHWPLVAGTNGLRKMRFAPLHPVLERAAACVCAISSLLRWGAYIW